MLIKMTTADAAVDPRNKRPLRVVVIYENVRARIRIQHSCWVLMNELVRDYNFDCSWFGFDDLKRPRVAMNARFLAADADIILFSVSAETVVPREVREWIESWIGSKAGQDTALAALLSREKSGRKRRSRVWTYLSEIARRAGMSFLPQIPEPGGVCSQAA